MAKNREISVHFLTNTILVLCHTAIISQEVWQKGCVEQNTGQMMGHDSCESPEETGLMYSILSRSRIGII